ncbi:hypothetical protein SNE40_015628 [Patella caerulea]|uniref:Chitin-binding type-2 domain-containing protein n=1 Tax=Patella caerulea TaxID=87958 RepID=A0AAN8JKB6_PATCE
MTKSFIFIGLVGLMILQIQAQLNTNWQQRYLNRNRLNVNRGLRQSPPDLPSADLCPNGYEGYIAFPGNCTRFIQCGIPGLNRAAFTCSPGTSYSVDLKQCIRSELVTCVNGVRPTGTRISGRTGLVNNQWNTNRNTNRNTNARWLTNRGGVVVDSTRGRNRWNTNTNTNTNNNLNNRWTATNNRLNTNNNRWNTGLNTNRNTAPIVNSNLRRTIELPLISNNQRILDSAQCTTIQNRLNAALPELVRAFSSTCKDTACLSTLPNFRVRCSQTNSGIFTG